MACVRSRNHLQKHLSLTILATADNPFEQVPRHVKHGNKGGGGTAVNISNGATERASGVFGTVGRLHRKIIGMSHREKEVYLLSASDEIRCDSLPLLTAYSEPLTPQAVRAVRVEAGVERLTGCQSFAASKL